MGVDRLLKNGNTKWDITILLIVIVVGFLFSSCDNKVANSSEVPLARVGDSYLFWSDVEHSFSDKIEAKDSIEIVQKYIQDWIKEMLVLHQAENNLTDERKSFDKMVENYRRSLITYQYESELVSQKLDTVVSDLEIERYYQENKGNFELKDNIIKVKFVKVRKNAPKIDKIKDWYRSDDTKSMDALANYCHQYAENFFLDDNTWLLFDDLLKEIPIKLYDKEQFLRNNRIIETQDSTFMYFVNIKGFMTKNSESPLSFERASIQSIIINKRKVVLIKKMREDIFEAGIKNKTFEIF